MAELFDLTKKLSVKTIAMPAIGTGKILRYPSREVAEVLVAAAVKVTETRAKLEVKSTQDKSEF